MKSLEIVNEIINYIKEYHTAPLLSLEELNKVKQDLEVLEILRKYRIDLIGLDNEDYNKLKQWLEENE